MQSTPSHCEVVELLGQPAEVAAAVVVAVGEAADVDLVEDGPLEPERVGLEPLRLLLAPRRSLGVRGRCIADGALDRDRLRLSHGARPGSGP